MFIRMKYEWLMLFAKPFQERKNRKILQQAKLFIPGFPSFWFQMRYAIHHRIDKVLPGIISSLIPMQGTAARNSNYLLLIFHSISRSNLGRNSAGNE